MILANTIFSWRWCAATLLALREFPTAALVTLALPQDHAYFKIFEMNYDKISSRGPGVFGGRHRRWWAPASVTHHGGPLSALETVF